jgi:hypothetical protein
VALATVLALISTMSANARSGVRSVGGDPTGSVAAGGSSSRLAAPEIPARIVTVDGEQFAGAENAIYAADQRTIYVAYKRFLRDPIHPGGDVVPAELRLAKSEDGGRTWHVTVVDTHAAEKGDVVQESVSIGGDHHMTVYIAYLVEPLTGGMRLKIAKSTDGGKTWAIRLLAQATGEYKDMKVIDAKTVLVASGSALSPDLLIFTTNDGGDTWRHSLVGEGPARYVGMDRRSDGHIWINAYDGGHHDLSTMGTTSPLGRWSMRLAAGQSGDDFYTGLWGAIDVVQAEIFIAFEDYQPSTGRSVIRFIRSSDWGDTWQRFSVDQGAGVGGKISLRTWRTRAVGEMDLFLSYRFYNSTAHQGRARLAHSSDHGQSWTVSTLPDRGSLLPYIDTAVVSRDIQYVSYQVVDADTHDQVLRFAQVDLTP